MSVCREATVVYGVMGERVKVDLVRTKYNEDTGEPYDFHYQKIKIKVGDVYFDNQRYISSPTGNINIYDQFNHQYRDDLSLPVKCVFVGFTIGDTIADHKRIKEFDVRDQTETFLTIKKMLESLGINEEPKIYCFIEHS